MKKTIVLSIILLISLAIYFFFSPNGPREKSEALTHSIVGTTSLIKDKKQEKVLTEESSFEVVDLEEKDDEGNTPIIRALDSENYEFALELLKMGANPNVRNRDGITATGMAAMTGNFELYKSFAELTGEINPSVYAGKRALSLAVLDGDSIMVKYIFENSSVEIDYQDSMGQSYLYLAILGGNFEIAQLLVQKGANPDLKNNEGESSRKLALNSDQEEFVQLFGE